MLRLSFHGAAETVTGSKYLIEADQARVMVDCGLFQGLKELRLRNWQPLPFKGSTIQSVVLTHAHIDHTGYLPCLVKDRFRGPIYCTPATSSLTDLLLQDAAKNQEEDASYANRKGFSKHKPALPLYSEEDAVCVTKLLKPVPINEWFTPAEPIWMRYHDVGHLLGATTIEVEIRNKPTPTRIVFSGDVGRYDAPLYYDPTPPRPCDYLICESTYGDRNHPPEQVLDQLCDVVLAAVRRGGVMLVAAFAVGRAQQLTYLLNVLTRQKRIPVMPIYLDSPMAVVATNIFKIHAADHDIIEGKEAGIITALDGPNIHLTQSVAESKQINNVAGPAVIISASGMMTGGRILHHLKQRLSDARNTIVLAGYMAEGTRGRLLQDGVPYLRLLGSDVKVRAAVVPMSALSGHAGHDELLRWVSPLPPPKKTFITHGELPSATFFANELHRLHGWDVLVPRMGQSFELE
jgi:metallo-beta-lactamase family protein